MSAKHIRTIGDLWRFKASVRVDCRKCFAATTMSGMVMAELFGFGPLEKAEKRFRCSRCGAREARLVVLPPR